VRAKDDFLQWEEINHSVNIIIEVVLQVFKNFLRHILQETNDIAQFVTERITMPKRGGELGFSKNQH
jgi:hypothetical protein